MVQQWEHFPHEADIGIRGTGSTPAQAFEQAALALTAVIIDPDSVRPLAAIHLHCEAPNLELLFYDWLNQLIFEMATRNMLFNRFEVSIQNGILDAEVRGDRIDQARDQPATEIKGATFTELKVSQRGDGSWMAQCVVDV